MTKTYERFITRRDFFKKTCRATVFAGAAAFGLESILSGCASFDPKKDWSQIPPEEFDIKTFDAWYKRKKLYNGRNPNLKRPHSTMHTFKGAFNPGWTPGIGYRVQWNEVMVAAAPGRVVDIHALHTGRAGGNVVGVGHPFEISESRRHTRLFHTYYAHLNKVFVKLGQKVERGEPIGNVTEHRNYAKLVFKRNSRIDPDNYGMNHSYMKYNSDVTIDDKEMISNSEIVQEKWAAQGRIYKMFIRHFYNGEELPLDTKMHRKRGNGACQWSRPEKFKYLETLYEVNPDLFPEISQEKFQSMKKDFYDNQPIVLTLPLVKGGMKKYK